MGASPFTRITIDGHVLEDEAIIAWAERSTMEHEGFDPAGTMLATLKELVQGDGSLQASTSGTTGPPKPMRLSTADLIASARLTQGTFQLHHGDRVLHCLPCAFVAGKLMFVRAFVTGLDLHVIDPRGSVLQHLRTTDRFRFASMVPQQLHRALEEDRAQLEDRFGTILVGGGPVSDVLIKRSQHLRTRLFHSYGSTETLTHVALRPLNGPDRSEHFTAIGEVTFSFDPRGCLIIHTPHLSTKRHITNDVVELIDERRFHWLGRYDNVILSGGKKIFPEQLEARTQAVIALPHFFTSVADDVLGQGIVLVVESSGPEEQVIADLRKAIDGVLSKHELPRRVVVRNAFKRTAGGKIIRSGTL